MNIDNYQIKAQSSNSKKFSRAIRVWHWANAILISISLLIVLVNFTILKPENNISYVQSMLGKMQDVNQEKNTIALCRFFSDKLWVVHAYIGFGISALLIFRIVSAVFTKQRTGFLGRGGIQILATRTDRHTKGVRIVYSIFYTLISIMAITGLSVAYQGLIPFLAGNSNVIKILLDLHYYTMYGIVAFAVIHLLGVLLAEKTANRGIVSDMINGGKV